MEQQTVTRLERLLEKAIKKAIATEEHQLPIVCTSELVRAMAKAATTVYEAVADNR